MCGPCSEVRDPLKWTKLVVPDTSLGAGSAFLNFISENSQHGPPRKGQKLVEKTRIRDIIEEVKSDIRAVGIVPEISLNDDSGTKCSIWSCGARECD